MRAENVIAVIVLVGAATWAFARSLDAQQHAEIELGTSLGVQWLSAPGANTVTTVGIPGNGIQATPTLYLTAIVSRSLFLEPQISWMRVSTANGAAESLGFVARVGWLFRRTARESPYVAGDVAYDRQQSPSSFGATIRDAGFAWGGAVGYRIHVGRGLALRFEGHYRRWGGDFAPVREMGLGVGVGGVP